MDKMRREVDSMNFESLNSENAVRARRKGGGNVDRRVSSSSNLRVDFKLILTVLSPNDVLAIKALREVARSDQVYLKVVER